MICVFGFLWVPQIITNIFEHPAWRFNYSFSFSLIQSIYFIFPPLYAKGFHNNFYYLKPDPMPVRALLFLYLAQIVLMQLLIQYCLTWRAFLKLTQTSCLHKCCTRPCRRAVRRFVLRKLKEEHEWGWKLAVQRIAL